MLPGHHLPPHLEPQPGEEGSAPEQAKDGTGVGRSEIFHQMRSAGLSGCPHVPPAHVRASTVHGLGIPKCHVYVGPIKTAVGACLTFQGPEEINVPLVSHDCNGEEGCELQLLVTIAPCCPLQLCPQGRAEGTQMSLGHTSPDSLSALPNHPNSPMKKVLNSVASSVSTLCPPSAPQTKFLELLSCSRAVAGALSHTATSSLKPTLPVRTSALASTFTGPLLEVLGSITGDTGHGATVCRECSRGHQAELRPGLHRALMVDTFQGKGTAGQCWGQQTQVAFGDLGAGCGCTATVPVWVPMTLVGGDGWEAAGCWCATCSALLCSTHRCSFWSLLGWAGGGCGDKEPCSVGSWYSEHWEMDLHTRGRRALRGGLGLVMGLRGGGGVGVQTVGWVAQGSWGSWVPMSIM